MDVCVCVCKKCIFHNVVIHEVDSIMSQFKNLEQRDDEVMNYKSFGKLVQAKRLELGVKSQKDLATKIGVQVKEIMDLESRNVHNHVLAQKLVTKINIGLGIIRNPSECARL